MTIELTPDETKLLILILEQASEMFGNQICDDFELAEHLPLFEARRTLMKEYHQYNGDPEVFEEDEAYGDQYLYIGTGALVGYLASRIKAQQEKGDTRT